MMSTERETAAELVKTEPMGFHTCGEQWGWCGEHKYWAATYECPMCGFRETIEQCAAWPISVIDCPHCLATMHCEMCEAVVGVALR